jgi:signal transduction histidine kinase
LFAGILTAALLAFSGAVYVAAVIAEAAEDEPESEKQRELAAVRHVLSLALLAGVPIAVTAAVGGAHLLSRHALASVGRIVRTANMLTLENLDVRIASDPSAGREVEELVAALNAMLDRIDRSATSLRRFIADAAHELRTPLAVLSSEIEVCLHRPRDPETLRETLGAALEGLGRLSRLVDILLTLARSDAGELPVAPTEVDAADLVAQIAAPFEAAAIERGVRLTVTLPDPPTQPACTLRTDPLLLGRALANLLDNACKFCPSGGTVTLQLRRTPIDVELSVRDSGPGLSADDLARACDRFYRAPIHRGNTDGFGLGLALTREFMRALGGSLALRPAPPCGTEAILKLPLPVRP